MDKAEVFRLIDGLRAGVQQTNGIRDEQKKDELRKWLHAQGDLPENEHRIYPVILDEYAYDYIFSPEARAEGYGLEDVKSFLEWLDEEMNIV